MVVEITASILNEKKSTRFGKKDNDNDKIRGKRE